MFPWRIWSRLLSAHFINHCSKLLTTTAFSTLYYIRIMQNFLKPNTKCYLPFTHHLLPYSFNNTKTVFSRLWLRLPLLQDPFHTIYYFFFRFVCFVAFVLICFSQATLWVHLGNLNPFWHDLKSRYKETTNTCIHSENLKKKWIHTLKSSSNNQLIKLIHSSVNMEWKSKLDIYLMIHLG